jgi:hypothetical protein
MKNCDAIVFGAGSSAIQSILDPQANEQAAEFVPKKIRQIVQAPAVANDYEGFVFSQGPRLPGLLPRAAQWLRQMAPAGRHLPAGRRIDVFDCRVGKVCVGTILTSRSVQ